MLRCRTDYISSLSTIARSPASTVAFILHQGHFLPRAEAYMAREGRIEKRGLRLVQGTGSLVRT